MLCSGSRYGLLCLLITTTLEQPVSPAGRQCAGKRASSLYILADNLGKGVLKRKNGMPLHSAAQKQLMGIAECCNLTILNRPADMCDSAPAGTPTA